MSHIWQTPQPRFRRPTRRECWQELKLYFGVAVLMAPFALAMFLEGR